MVQRYWHSQDGVSLDPRENGDWVRYEDYAALELKLLAAHSHIERALASSLNKKDVYIKIALRELE